MSDTRRPGDATINTTLMRMGISPHLRGHQFLPSAVRLRLDGETRSICQKVAELQGTSVSMVERNIRTAIQYAWKCGALPRFCESIGRTVERCPSSSEFIALAAYVIETTDDR